jgi:hypothetical protein
MRLTHSFTPEPLKSINEKLEEILHYSDFDDELLTAFVQLIDVRSTIIETHLALLPNEQRTVFVEHELPNNQFLLEQAKTQHQAVKSVLAKFTQSRRAIAEYK